MKKIDTIYRKIYEFSGKLNIGIFNLIALFAILILYNSSAVAGNKSEIPDIDSLTAVFQSDNSMTIPDSSSGIQSYLDYAATNNPAVRAAFFNWKAAIEKSKYAGSLPDPVLSYGYFIENVETRVGPQKQRFGIMQSIPWFGTLGSRRQIASENASIAYEKFVAEKLRTNLLVKRAFYEYYYLGKEIDLTRDNFELLKFWESVARARYRVALSNHPDVIKSQIELAMLEDRLLSLNERKDFKAALLIAAANLPENMQVLIPGVVKISETVIDDVTALREIKSNNPGLEVLEIIIAREKAGMKLASKLTRPSFKFGINYIETGERSNFTSIENGKDAWGINVGISLPIWFGKNSARKNESKAKYQAAKYNYGAGQINIDATAKNVLFKISDADRKIRLYKNGLVPKAEQSLNATFTAYQSGEKDFLSLLDAQRQLLEFQLQYERSRVDLAIAQAELEVLAGSNLFK